MAGRAFFWAVLFASVAACSSSSSGGGAAGGNTVSGTGPLAGWTKFAASHWIANPDPVSTPVILFLFESPIECSAISALGWDSSVTTRVLEINLWEVTDGGPILTGGSGPLLGSSLIASPRTFTIDAAAIGTAYVAYLSGAIDAEASEGTVTIDRLTPAQNIVGSLDVKFPAAGASAGPASATGSFDAKWCATGVEP